MSAYDPLLYYETKWKYSGILLFFQKIAIYCSKLQLFLVLSGILINTFHLIILSQKSLRANAINILLIGIAISDILFLFDYFRFFIIELSISGLEDQCYSIPPDTYLQVLLQWISQYSRDISRRVSSWLGVITALIRAIVIKCSTSTKIKSLLKASTSWKLITLITLISALISSINYGRLHVYEAEKAWIAPESCPNIAANTSLPQFSLSGNPFFTDYSLIITQTFLVLDGFLKLTPPIFYPILAGLLIFEIRKSTDNRNQLRKNNQSLIKDNDVENITKVVIWMTVSYFLSEAPIGISYLLQAGYWLNPGFIFIISYLTTVFVTLLMVHFCSNFFICFALNSQYRNTVKSIFGCYQSVGIVNSRGSSRTD